MLAWTAAIALTLPARAQDAPLSPDSAAAAPAHRGLSLLAWGFAQSSAQSLGDADAARKKGSWLEAARLALIVQRDHPGSFGTQGSKLLQDVAPHLSLAEIACLRGWFRRQPELEVRYTRALADGGRADEARAHAIAAVRDFPPLAKNKDLLNLLGTSTPNRPDAPIAPVATQSPYHVALLVPLKGEYEAYGRSLRAGLEIAVWDFNSSGAKLPIWLEVEETEGEGWRAALEGKQVLDGGAGILVGDVLTVPTLVLAGLANQTGVPLLSPSATDPRVGATGPFVFQTGAPVDAQARALARYAVQTDKRKTIAAPADLDSAFLKPFEAQARQLGAKVVRVPVSRGMRDFKPVAIELARTRADVVLLPLDPEQAELWVGGLMKVGIFLPFLGTDAIDPQGFHADTRRVLEGMTAVSSDYALPEAVFAHVDSLAHAAYGLPADRFVRRGYLTGRVIASTLAGGADSPTSFAKALRTRVGALGFIQYEESIASLPILSVRRGQLVRVH